MKKPRCLQSLQGISRQNASGLIELNVRGKCWGTNVDKQASDLERP